MVTFIRFADLNGTDKLLEAREWAKNVAAYVNGKFGFSKVECGVEVYGRVLRFYWIGRQESLETLAKGTEQSLADPGYLQMLQKGVGLFVAGSAADTVIVGI